MKLPELREELHEYINRADESILKVIYAISKESENSIIVGYNTDDTPITNQELKKRVKAASQRVKTGDFLTQKEIEQEIENW